MTAKELFQAGKLTEAVQALGAELRENPTDAKRRTFLFELLCFAGDFDRAEKHLHLLSEGGPNKEMGALLYRGVLAAERARQETFLKREYPAQPEQLPCRQVRPPQAASPAPNPQANNWIARRRLRSSGWTG